MGTESEDERSMLPMVPAGQARWQQNTEHVLPPGFPDACRGIGTPCGPPGQQAPPLSACARRHGHQFFGYLRPISRTGRPPGLRHRPADADRSRGNARTGRVSSPRSGAPRAKFRSATNAARCARLLATPSGRRMRSGACSTTGVSSWITTAASAPCAAPSPPGARRGSLSAATTTPRPPGTCSRSSLVQAAPPRPRDLPARPVPSARPLAQGPLPRARPQVLGHHPRTARRQATRRRVRAAHRAVADRHADRRAARDERHGLTSPTRGSLRHRATFTSRRRDAVRARIRRWPIGAG